MSQDQLFRKAALDRLASPDQLDRVVTVAGARSWIAFLGLLVGLGFLMGWGIYGSVPTTVTAKGILVPRNGRVVAAMSPAAGTVAEVSVRVGESVRKGQVVARIAQDEARQKLEHARQVAAERREDRAAQGTRLAQELTATLAAIDRRRAALGQAADAARDRIRYLEALVARRQEMLSKGFSTLDAVQTAQDDLSRARSELADALAEVSGTEADVIQARLDSDRQSRTLDQQVAEADRQVAALSTAISLASEVVAPEDGRVSELALSPGVVVGVGTAILSIESAGDGLQAVVFIPTQHGKSVHPGMAARIAPAPVKKEEDGTLRGHVAGVTPFPATRQAMAAVVQNDTLIEDFAKDGAPYEARIDLVPAATPSGYAWTSGAGPAVVLTSGTTVEAAIAVREQAPVTLILPFFRRVIGVEPVAVGP